MCRMMKQGHNDSKHIYILYRSKQNITSHCYEGHSRTRNMLRRNYFSSRAFNDINSKLEGLILRWWNNLFLIAALQINRKQVVMLCNISTTPPFSSLYYRAIFIQFPAHQQAAMFVDSIHSLKAKNCAGGGKWLTKKSVTQRHSDEKTRHNIKSSRHSAKTNPLRHQHT